MSQLSSTLHMSWKIKEGGNSGGIAIITLDIEWEIKCYICKYYIHKVCAGVGDLKKINK